MLLLPVSTSFGLLTGAAVVIVYLASLLVLPVLLVRRPGGAGRSVSEGHARPGAGATT